MLVQNVKPYYFNNLAVLKNNAAKKADVQNSQRAGNAGLISYPAEYYVSFGNSISSEQKEIIIDMFRAGETPETIAQLTEQDISEVRKVLKDKSNFLEYKQLNTGISYRENHGSADGIINPDIPAEEIIENGIAIAGTCNSGKSTDKNNPGRPRKPVEELASSKIRRFYESLPEGELITIQEASASLGIPYGTLIYAKHADKELASLIAKHTSRKHNPDRKPVEEPASSKIRRFYENLPEGELITMREASASLGIPYGTLIYAKNADTEPASLIAKHTSRKHNPDRKPVEEPASSKIRRFYENLPEGELITMREASASLGIPYGTLYSAKNADTEPASLIAKHTSHKRKPIEKLASSKIRRFYENLPEGELITMREAAASLGISYGTIKKEKYADTELASLIAKHTSRKRKPIEKLASSKIRKFYENLPEGELITMREAAASLGISYRTLSSAKNADTELASLIEKHTSHKRSPYRRRIKEPIS